MDCVVALECQDENHYGLAKRIMLLCMIVKITSSLINSEQDLQVFNFTYTDVFNLGTVSILLLVWYGNYW